MRIGAGPVEAIPTKHCVAVGDGKAVVVRIRGEVVAFPNRCLHQNSPLADGVVLDGILICPMHFWRYRLPEGTHIGSGSRLAAYPVEIVGGEVFIEVPDPEPKLSMRDLLLKHAREWAPNR
ncbi:MAG: Rieske (2Fe-2S) protein [Actinomycetota bacterium]